jgi:tetratricopeptide (TPR) repeat protein
MEASIVSIASDEDAKSTGIEASSPSILRWLDRREDNWLMIFDGADQGYEAVEAFIPPGKHGNILISSRNATMKRLSLPPSACMEVLELDEDAAVELLIKSANLGSPSPAEQGHAKMIVRELCCLALAVDQAGSSIATEICRVDEYLSLYKRRRRQLMDDDFFNGSSNYGRAVYTTWDISFVELERRALSSSPNSASYQAAILLLRIFSFFHFDGIREETFRRAAEATDDDWRPLEVDPNSPLSHLLERSESNTWDSFNFRKAIHILTQWSLIRSDGSAIYSMHRLVHQWMQDRLPMSSRSEMVLLAATVLAQSEDYRECAEDYAHRRALLVHLVPLSAHLKQAGLTNELSVDVIKRIARVYHEGGKAADAEVLLRQAISILQKDTSEATGHYIDLVARLADAVWDLGRLREAEALDREVLEWREKHLGSNHNLTATAKNDLAATLHDLGELGQAKELKIQVLDWRKVYLGMDHPDTYWAMANLAATLQARGKLEEAKELSIQVLDWRKVHLGMEHPDTYLAMANLAATLHDLRELEEAKELKIQVLDWRKVHLGMDHPDTYLAMAHLASTIGDLGELGKARELEMKVLEWRKEHLGMDHPETFRAMANLAYSLRDLDELSEAKGLEVRVLDWRRAHLGPRHRLTILAMKNLASTLRKSGEVREAEELFAQVEELRGATERSSPDSSTADIVLSPSDS